MGRLATVTDARYPGSFDEWTRAVPQRRPPLTTDIARSMWDSAADAYTDIQEAGDDYLPH